jgi:hypothetical protein
MYIRVCTYFLMERYKIIFKTVVNVSSSRIYLAVKIVSSFSNVKVHSNYKRFIKAIILAELLNQLNSKN